MEEPRRPVGAGRRRAGAGGGDDYPLYIPNDHTVVAIHISATGTYGVDPNALDPNAQYNVKLRLSTSPSPSAGNSRGWTWNGSSPVMWVQERDPSWNTPPCNFPIVTTDANGQFTGSAGWFYFKFGDTTKSGAYYIIASLEPVGSTGGSTLNGTLAPAVTVIDMASGGFWMHDGVASGVAIGKRAEADLDGSSTVASLQKTETNTCDDDSNDMVDDEDYGPSGKNGDFMLAGPTSQTYDIYLSSHAAWTPGQNVSSSTADVDLAVGATDATAPTAPTGLTAAPLNGGVDLTWTAASDNVTVTGYCVYRWTDPTPIGGSTNYTSLHAKVATVTSGTSYSDTGLTNGTKYFYEVRAFDAATNVGPRAEANAVPQTPTALLFAPPLTTTPAFGVPVNLTGTLTSGGAPLAGQPAALESSADGTSGWTTVNTFPASADGSYAYDVVPEVTTSYRLRFEGAGPYGPSTTAAVTINPGAWVSKPSAPLRLYKGHKFMCSGFLRPHHTAGSRSVRIQCQRRINGTWVLKKTVAPLNHDYSTYTKFSARFSLPTAGRWRLRTLHVADAFNAQATSAWRYRTVR